MSKLYGLVDCNNFFVSCERVFRPDLDRKPVVVLSNNDGCIVSRSNEAKEMGIPMGLPFFKIGDYDPLRRVTAFSSNYALYADLSRRVMLVITEAGLDLTPYSIDESFVSFGGEDDSFREIVKSLPELVMKCTGIPVSVGLASSKTLAKLACRFAKKYNGYNGFCEISSEAARLKALSLIEIGDVWGIGRRRVEGLRKAGIKTARDFTMMSEQQVRHVMGITGLRTWRELHGVDSISVDNSESKKSICTSRSFADMVTSYEQLSAHVADFASMSSVKLRQQHSAANIVSVYIGTNVFRSDLGTYCNTESVVLPMAASSQMEIVNAALFALKRIFKPQVAYKKAAVIVSGIVSDNAIQQPLFGNDPERRRRMEKLSVVIDDINKNKGRDKVHLGVQMVGKMAQADDEGVTLANLRREYKSPAYTTDWNEILKVVAK